MASKKEHGVQVERVIARKDGGMKPADMQCRALELDEKGDSTRCEESITYDQEGGFWSKLCQGHHSKDQAARKSGAPRVERV